MAHILKTPNEQHWQQGAHRHVLLPLSADVISTAPEPQSAPSTSGQERPDVVAVLRERGLIQDVTSDALQKAALADSLSVYCGFDPTADSLHLGNLLGIIVLSWFQRCGHQPVALLGGATGRVGDPSGRSTERPILSEEQIERNVAGERCRAHSALLRSHMPSPGDGPRSQGFARLPAHVVTRVGDHDHCATQVSVHC